MQYKIVLHLREKLPTLRDENLSHDPDNNLKPNTSNEGFGTHNVNLL